MNDSNKKKRDIYSLLKYQDLKAYLEKEGHKFEGDKMICPFHADTVPSFSVYQTEDEFYRWHCFGCEESGSIIDYEMRENNLSQEKAVGKLTKHFGLEPKIVAEYPYTDEDDNVLYKVRRIEPGHDFPVDRKMKGIRRVLYHLSKMLKADDVWLVEGEKDVETLEKLGFVATTWVSGKGNWRSEYAEFFKGKNVRLCLDTDVKEEIVNYVATSILEAGASSLTHIELDLKEGKDISDWVEENKELSKEKLQEKLLQTILKAIKNPQSNPVSRENISYQFNSSFEGTPEDNEIEVKNSFLCEYVESISKITDAPQCFILFSGLALLSAVLNHFYFSWVNPTHLNLYILLLAQSTTERKSTLIDIAYDYLKEVGRIAPEPTNLIYPSVFSLEAFFDELEGRKRGIILWRELNTVKALFSKTYGKGLPSKFTDIWDGRPISQRFKKEGFRKVDDPVVSILCGGIGEWLVEGLRRLDFQGGLWTRFLFVPVAPRKMSYRLPGSFTYNSEIIHKLRGLIALAPEAMDIEAIKPAINCWMVEITKEKQTLGDAIAETFYNKLEINAVKIACLLQLASNFSITVGEEAILDAITICEWIKRRLLNLLRGFMQSDWDRERERILNVLKRRGESTTKEIYQFANIDSAHGIKHLENLIQEDLIGSRGTKKGSRGRPGRIFFLIK